jgi:hypothetical protein
MHAIADTERLVADGVIDAAQAREIEVRAREAMVTLGINSILCFGIVASTAGLIFWLADAVLVAGFGALAMLGGFAILARGTETYRMFGNAAALIGAGMLIGGGIAELLDKYDDIAHMVLTCIGAIIAGVAGTALQRDAITTRFVTGAIFLMGLVTHLVGVALFLITNETSGIFVSFSYLYAAALLVGAGWLTDVRLITVAAILPFAQALDTGTFYMHAAYVFVSPEPTLSILQMALLVIPCLWIARHWNERTARHARVLAVLGFIVANLCALVGSLWGDVVGETIWGPPSYSDLDLEWEDYEVLRDTWRASALTISANSYAILWALLLSAGIAYSAFRANRGMFNTALTFAAIHAYTQLFESFGDEPLAYVIGGLAAIPLAWGMWRLNQWITQKQGSG